MAWKLSTGLRNAMLEGSIKARDAMVASTLSYTAAGGEGGLAQILDSGNGLAGFNIGDFVTIIGSTNNDGKYGQINTVAAGELGVSVMGAAFTAESAGTSAIIVSSSGGSLRGIFRNGVIRIYSGTQPVDANTSETGTLLCQITLGSGVFTPGAETNGLNFGQTTSGTTHKATGEVWSGVNLATGTAGWFRIYDNARTTGTSTTGIRLDGACATSASQMNLTSTALTVDVTTTIDTVNLSMPAS